MSDDPGGRLDCVARFVPKLMVFLPVPPDWEEEEAFWSSGELLSCYADWKVEQLEERIFDCDSSGIPHQHCMDVLIARKMV